MTKTDRLTQQNLNSSPQRKPVFGPVSPANGSLPIQQPLAPREKASPIRRKAVPTTAHSSNHLEPTTSPSPMGSAISKNHVHNNTPHHPKSKRQKRTPITPNYLRNKPLPPLPPEAQQHLESPKPLALQYIDGRPASFALPRSTKPPSKPTDPRPKSAVYPSTARRTASHTSSTPSLSGTTLASKSSDSLPRHNHLGIAATWPACYRPTPEPPLPDDWQVKLRRVSRFLLGKAEPARPLEYQFRDGEDDLKVQHPQPGVAVPKAYGDKVAGEESDDEEQEVE